MEKAIITTCLIFAYVCFLSSRQLLSSYHKDQIRSDIGLLRVDKRNSTIYSRNDTRNNVE